MSDGITWMNDLTDCPGIPTSPTSCLIPMSTLVSRFGLAQGALITAKVRAQNILGYGDFSEANTQGAALAVAPYKMQSPFLGTNINLN